MTSVPKIKYRKKRDPQPAPDTQRRPLTKAELEEMTRQAVLNTIAMTPRRGKGRGKR